MKNHYLLYLCYWALKFLQSPPAPQIYQLCEIGFIIKSYVSYVNNALSLKSMTTTNSPIRLFFNSMTH